MDKLIPECELSAGLSVGNVNLAAGPSFAARGHSQLLSIKWKMSFRNEAFQQWLG